MSSGKVAIAGVWHSKKVASEDLDMRASYMALKEYYAEVQKFKTQQQQKLLLSNKSNAGRRSQAKANGNDSSSGVMGKDALDALWARAQNYVLAMQDNLSGWRFIVTQRGFVGVAPPAVQTGGCGGYF
jgi:hypothetical protein